MTIAFGHGIAVSPLQVAPGTAAMVNGGILHRPTLLKKSPEQAGLGGKRVISESTSRDMRRLLRLVVDQGTGKKAAVEGYLVGGKTGSAEKLGRHGYSHSALISSFVGAFPMDDPRYVVLAVLDEPKGNKETYGYATGGWVAAPVIHRVVARIAPVLGFAPIDEAAPEIRKEFAIELQPERRLLACF